jgi:hypothetical protein
VLDNPVAVAVNCADFPAASEIDCGASVTEAGTNVTSALAILVGSATLFAVTVRTCWLLIELGAVYCPDDETDPTVGVTDQITDVLFVPVTVGVNCVV